MEQPSIFTEIFGFDVATTHQPAPAVPLLDDELAKLMPPTGAADALCEQLQDADLQMKLIGLSEGIEIGSTPAPVPTPVPFSSALNKFLADFASNFTTQFAKQSPAKPRAARDTPDGSVRSVKPRLGPL